MNTILFLALTILLIHLQNIGTEGTKVKKVKSSGEDKSEEAKDKSSSDEDVILQVPTMIKKERPTPRRNLTFMVAASNLGKTPITLNPYVSIFYETKTSDLNSQSSEVITGSANPVWNTVFSFLWRKGTEQKIKFKVKSQIKKSSDQLLGEATLDVDEYVKNGEQIDLNLQGGKGFKGVIEVEKTIPVSFRLSARGLARKDTFNGKSDPYVKCYWRHGPDGSDVKFGKTKHINNVEDVDWLDIITYDAYQPGKDHYWHFKVWDEDGFTSDDFLGEAFIKIDPFLESEGGERTKTVSLSLKGTLTVKLV